MINAQVSLTLMGIGIPRDNELEGKIVEICADILIELVWSKIQWIGGI